jgi:hypothetical protein
MQHRARSQRQSAGTAGRSTVGLDRKPGSSSSGAAVAGTCSQPCSAPCERGAVGSPVGAADAVPHIQAAPALRHHHVAARHPLHVLAEAQQVELLLRGEVDQVQLVRLVAEQQVAAPAVELLRRQAGRQAGMHTGRRVPASHCFKRSGACTRQAADVSSGQMPASGVRGWLPGCPQAVAADARAAPTPAAPARQRALTSQSILTSWLTVASTCPPASTSMTRMVCISSR